MSDRDELARQMYIGDNWGVAEPERQWDELLAHPVEFERYRARADVLWAAGWRKKPKKDELIAALASESNWTDGSPRIFMEAKAADAILALMDGLSDE